MPSHGVDPDAWIPLAILGRPRGLAGAMWLYPYNIATESLRPGVSVRVVPPSGEPRVLKIASLDEGGRGLVAQFTGVDTRAAAEVLTRAAVELRRRELPPLGPGEYYHVDLPGMPVVDPEGRPVGEVVRVEAYPSVDALVVKTADGEREFPVTDLVVLDIDVAGGKIVVDLAPMDAP